MDNKQALNDFLLYSYFGCDSKELASGRKPECAYRAYLDLSRRIDFCYSSSTLDNMLKKNASEEQKSLANKYSEEKRTLIETVCSEVLCLVNDDNCINKKFDLWHRAKCEKIRGTMNSAKLQDGTSILKGPDSFTYGLAQKWVNMTLKYLWLLDMLPKGLAKESLHAPIDSFILEALKDKNVDNVSKDGDTYKYKCKAWSQMDDYNTYMELQNEIRQVAGNTSPIEWECHAWMAIAKKRNSK